ncbi:MAG TPA: hypothetical protein VIW45_17485, partial [Vicinamibacterales bacterium]
VSVGRSGGGALLDLGYEEDSSAQVDCNVVGTASGKFVEVQTTAEQAPFSKPEFDEMLSLASTGLSDIFEAQWKVLEPVLEPLRIPENQFFRRPGWRTTRPSTLFLDGRSVGVRMFRRRKTSSRGCRAGRSPRRHRLTRAASGAARLS